MKTRVIYVGIVMLPLRSPIFGSWLCLLAAGCGATPVPSTPVPSTPVPSTVANPSSPATAALPDRDPALARQLVSDGALLLDVRTEAEWEAGHLEGAEHIAVDELVAKIETVATLTDGNKSTPIVLYCRSGARAGRAKTQLLAAGYTQVTNLGGMSDWKK